MHWSVGIRHAALKSHMTSDGGVHFESGYDCLTAGLTTHIKCMASNNMKNTSAGFSYFSGAKKTGKQSFYWRGFVSPVGTGRKLRAYMQSHSNPAAGRVRGGGGGKWRDSNISKVRLLSWHFCYSPTYRSYLLSLAFRF